MELHDEEDFREEPTEHSETCYLSATEGSDDPFYTDFLEQGTLFVGRMDSDGQIVISLEKEGEEKDKQQELPRLPMNRPTASTWAGFTATAPVAVNRPTASTFAGYTTTTTPVNRPTASTFAGYTTTIPTKRSSSSSMSAARNTILLRAGISGRTRSVPTSTGRNDDYQDNRASPSSSPTSSPLPPNKQSILQLALGDDSETVDFSFDKHTIMTSPTKSLSTVQSCKVTLETEDDLESSTTQEHEEDFDSSDISSDASLADGEYSTSAAYDDSDLDDTSFGPNHTGSISSMNGGGSYSSFLSAGMLNAIQVINSALSAPVMGGGKDTKQPQQLSYKKKEKPQQSKQEQSHSQDGTDSSSKEEQDDIEAAAEPATEPVPEPAAVPEPVPEPAAAEVVDHSSGRAQQQDLPATTTSRTSASSKLAASLLVVKQKRSCVLFLFWILGIVILGVAFAVIVPTINATTTPQADTSPIVPEIPDTTTTVTPPPTMVPTDLGTPVPTATNTTTTITTTITITTTYP